MNIPEDHIGCPLCSSQGVLRGLRIRTCLVCVEESGRGRGWGGGGGRGRRVLRVSAPSFFSVLLLFLL